MIAHHSPRGFVVQGTPYRSPAPRPDVDAAPWHVTWWQKLYVRIARALWDVRGPYRKARAQRRHQRNARRWKRLIAGLDRIRDSHGMHVDRLSRLEKVMPNRRPPPLPPRPLPPPDYVWE